MAAELVGGALLQAVFGVLLDRLTPHADFLRFFQKKKLDQTMLQRLKLKLIAAEAVLDDAERKQFKNNAVKQWLDELKDAVYDVQDLMDEISTKVATQNQVCDFASASLNEHDRDIADKLEAITHRLERIVNQKADLDLEKSSATEKLSCRPQSTSLVDESGVFGRDKEKGDIIELLSDDNDKLSVIPIVGMGGIGKTTLVQQVYGDGYVKEKFDLRAWVCVTETFNPLKITKTIMESMASNYCNNTNLDLLQRDLQEKLSGRKFLVVLDDVWDVIYTEWDALMNLFRNGMKGSKILVTTRSETVASRVKTIPSFYCVGLLRDEHCLSLFARHAFLSPDPTLNSCLEKIGRDITNKCKGLPLAAKALGGLFRTKPDIRYWITILKNDIWDSAEDEILPALRVSYYYLPSHLKQCFVYFSIFPKGYEFSKEDLTLMWLGEGFLDSSNRRMALEEVGYEYFDDLTSRSFFQPSNQARCIYFDCLTSRLLFQPLNSRCSYFVMHDLIHDLAISLAGDFCFRLQEHENVNRISSKTRHFSYLISSDPISNQLESFKEAKALRTVLGKIPLIFVSNLKYLRVLSLKSFVSLTIVPNSIGECIHLRYLDLSYTMIESLPQSLCKLCNLQTLKLQYCQNLKMWPSGMQDLVNLRHLDFQGTQVKEMPREMGKLKNLQFLSKFIVGREQGTTIAELGEIQNVKGSFEIVNLENISNCNESYESRMMEKEHIKDLRLSWSSNDCINDSQTERDIMDKLQPHRDLECLEIFCYRGTLFPDWLGSPSYHNMIYLRLEKCENCWRLPLLGQLPTLKALYIRQFERVVTVGAEFFKSNDCVSVIPFASLELLWIEDMSIWEEWHSIEMEAFPKLRELHISKCPKLTRGLPCQLLSLEVLKIEGCPLLSSSIPRCPKLQELYTSGSQNVVLQQQGLPPSLKRLEISGSLMLESVFEAMAHSKYFHLNDLTLGDCSKAVSLPIIHMPPSLTNLKIHNCKGVEFPMTQCHMSLKSLSISNSCDTHTYYPIEIFPNVSFLDTSNCDNLISVLASNAAPQNLQSISISNCKNLKSLSNDTESLLPNLEELMIFGCPEIDPFPEGFFPSSLRTLRIYNCDKLLARYREWHLPSISYLEIWDENGIVNCFPEGCSLPSPLTTLFLGGFSSLDTLNCEGLQHLTSLETLVIYNAPRLQKIAGEMLPASLRVLHISGCDLLKERYRKKDEESHIPAIRYT